MKTLINGQSVKIDNHKRGDGNPIKFKPGIHIHKRMNNDRYAGAEVELPLAEDEALSIEIRGNKKQETRLKSEIQNAFKDKKKRTIFVESMLEELNRKCTYKDDAEKLRSFLTSANNIAKHFGLKEVREPIVQNTQDIFETIHIDDENKYYYLLQDRKGENIRIGDSKDLVEKWDVIDWDKI